MELDCVHEYGQYQGNPDNAKFGFPKGKGGTVQGHEA